MWGKFTINKSEGLNYWMLLVFTVFCLCIYLFSIIFLTFIFLNLLSKALVFVRMSGQVDETQSGRAGFVSRLVCCWGSCSFVCWWSWRLLVGSNLMIGSNVNATPAFGLFVCPTFWRKKIKIFNTVEIWRTNILTEISKYFYLSGIQMFSNQTAFQYQTNRQLDNFWPF